MSLEPLELHGSQPALLATEYLGRMAGRKETIARLPQTMTPGRKLPRYLRSGLELIRMKMDNREGYFASQVSL